MPLYEFGCDECGAVVEVLQKYEDRAPECKCDSIWDMHRLVSRTSFTLKGTGWSRDCFGKYDITYGANGGGRGMSAAKIGVPNLKGFSGSS